MALWASSLAICVGAAPKPSYCLVQGVACWPGFPFSECEAKIQKIQVSTLGNRAQLDNAGFRASGLKRPGEFGTSRNTGIFVATDRPVE